MNARQSYFNTTKNLVKKDKKWNPKLTLLKNPKFNTFNNPNYINFGIFNSKMRYEERIKREELNPYPGRIFSARYIKPKSCKKSKKDSYFNLQTLPDNNRKRDLSMRISLNQNTNNKKNKLTLSHYLYQGTLTGQNLAGSYLFNYMPDYKNKNINQNLRKIICKEDPEISEEYNLVNELWEKLGVTESYVDRFDFVLNTKSNNREAILQMLKGEKKQMKKFRIELMKVISEISKRENKIKDLKQLIRAYGQIKAMNIFNENQGQMKKRHVLEVNRELIENDIHECLNSLRLRTINTVNLIRKFNTAYYNLFNSKINLKFIRNKYGYDDKYLTKIKNDLNFLKDSEINTLYHFSEKGGDPFLLYISDKCAEPSDLHRYRILPITNEVLAIIRTYMFSLEEEEIFLMIKNRDFQNQNQNQLFISNDNPEFMNYNMVNNNNFNNEFNNTNDNINPHILNNKNENNINNEVNMNNKNENNINEENNNEIKDEKKISSNNINNINNFNEQNFEEKIEDLHVNLNKTIELKVDKFYKIPLMSSRKLIRHLKKYEKMKRELFPPFNKDLIKEEAQKNIIKKIEDRMNFVEKEFNIKMDENFKKEQNNLKEKEMEINEEKEHIEKLRIEEEEERRNKEEKYLQSEKERNKRKKNEQKRKEDNEIIARKENEIFLREMQMKFMKELDDRFKNENNIQFETKKVIIKELEDKERERKEGILKIKYAEYKELKEAGFPIDLSEEMISKFEAEEASKNNGKSNKNGEEKEDESDNKSSKKNEKSSKNDESSKKEEEKQSNDNEDEEEESESKTKTKKSKSRRKGASSENEEEEEENEENSDSN